MPTTYANDFAAGLTQVLADGTRTYLYGAGRLAQYNTTMQYFGADGLGNVDTRSHVLLVESQGV